VFVVGAHLSDLVHHRRARTVGGRQGSQTQLSTAFGPGHRERDDGGIGQQPVRCAGEHIAAPFGQRRR